MYLKLKFTLQFDSSLSEENSTIPNVGADMLLKQGRLDRFKQGAIYWLDSCDTHPRIGRLDSKTRNVVSVRECVTMLYLHSIVHQARCNCIIFTLSLHYYSCHCIALWLLCTIASMLCLHLHISCIALWLPCT